MAKAKDSHQRLINVPLDVYADLQLIADLQDVPVADVMRDAFRHYTNDVLSKGKKRGAA